MDFISASSHLMRTCRNGSIPKKRSIVRLALDTDTHSFITHHSSFIILLKNSAKFCGSIVKRIRYGNLTPRDFSNSGAVERLLTNSLADSDHFFTAVFDYGEHGAIDGDGHEVITENIDQETNAWDVRLDPFSSFRAGFEIRTYRRCKRVLMFHNSIPGESNPVLVRSTDFHYTQNNDTLVSTLMAVTQRGYKKAPSSGNFQSEEIALGEPGVNSEFYEIKSIPRLDFGYTNFKPKEQRFKPFQAMGGDMPPRGLNDPNFALVDLFGTGLSDVLQTTPQGYYYWRNLGDGLFDRRQVLKNLPAGVTLDQDSVGFGDMAGDGQADLLVHAGQAWGFYEATNAGGWETFRPYRSVPSFSLNDSNTRMVDLTGDGKADALRTDQNAFIYFPCKGEEGFDKPKFVRRTHDLDEFPDVYFNDPRVQLADMTGDGLRDIVLVHSGRIDYWPNLGYGRFGVRITMKNAPHFGPHFDPSRLFLADIDGDGPADMVYVESGQVRFWFNQCGNSWSQENTIHGTPPVTNVDAVQFADLFGNGTTGILWSTDYRRPGRSNYLFLDLAGGVKPYVLTEVTNNMGATTRSEYKPSTHFYLEDLKKHKPWVSTVPFPVQVLAKTEVIDHIGKSKLVTEYTYHHGYYDGREREFRGFGRVEQLDTERFDDYNDHELSLHGDDTPFNTTDSDTHVPPILTKSWFHTGVYVDAEEHLEVFRREYYGEDSDSAAFEASFDVEETAEAYRALKGAILRTEVYALDGTPDQYRPYTATESGFQVKLIQPRGNNDNGVFFTTSLETFQFHYERNPEDPRISHQITHKVDDYGNVLEALNIVYPRRNPAYPEQDQFHITYDENTYINQPDSNLPYFIGLNAESKQTELNIETLHNTPLRPENPEDPNSPTDITFLLDNASRLIFWIKVSIFNAGQMSVD